MTAFEGEVTDDSFDLEEAEHGDRVPAGEDLAAAPQEGMNRRGALQTILGSTAAALGIVALLEKVAEASPRGKRRQKPAPAPEPAPRAARPAPQAEGRNTVRGQRALLDRLFKEAPRIRPPEGEYNRAKIDLWKRRYSGKDKHYDDLLLKYKRRKKMAPRTLQNGLLEGWNRLKNSGDLQMVHDACAKHGVPFEVVFLALAESHWNGKARSHCGAGGYWQFMPATARECQLRVKGRCDDRCDAKKSTEAALKYLKRLYNETYRWEGKKVQKDVAYTDSNRWAYTFWSYNRGGGRVRPYYRKFHGKATPYAQALAPLNSESANYVNKIFGIREAIGAYELPGRSGQQQPSPAPRRAGKTPADRLYEAYENDEARLAPKERLARLEAIKRTYESERKQGLLGADYVADALDVIEEEMADLKLEHPKLFEKDVEDDGVPPSQTKAKIRVGRGGELKVKIQKGSEKEREADVVAYAVQHGDNITDIATRLAGSSSKRNLVRELIIDLNPEIRDINAIRPGQSIKVPGKYIQVPRKRLGQLLAEYYPGIPVGDAEAYIKYLNGKNPVERIEPGETILVPAIR